MQTTDPFNRFAEWLDKAKNDKSIKEPTAMALATVGTNGQPSQRIVLLKGFNEQGFVFYTNLQSRKSLELGMNPRAALCFHWMSLGLQVRVEGNVQKVSDQEADAYFATRPRDSQIGAWASKQSEVIESRDVLLQAVKDAEKKFEGKSVPRPPFWSGWRVVPEAFEFWQEGNFRLHQRERYTRQGNGWLMQVMSP